jgi:hypothetical protein
MYRQIALVLEVFEREINSLKATINEMEDAHGREKRKLTGQLTDALREVESLKVGAQQQYIRTYVAQKKFRWRRPTY